MLLRRICAGLILCGALVAAAADPLIPPPPMSDANDAVPEQSKQRTTLPAIPDLKKNSTMPPATSAPKQENTPKATVPIPPTPDPALSSEPIPFDNPASQQTEPATSRIAPLPEAPRQNALPPNVLPYGTSPSALPPSTSVIPQFSAPSMSPLMGPMPQAPAAIASPYSGLGSVPQGLAGGVSPAAPYGMGPSLGGVFPMGQGFPASGMGDAGQGFGGPSPGVHARYPYYSYRRPWFTPGPRSVNVNIIW
jgi:hypothetical protein